MLLSHVIFEYTVIRLDLLEKSMPTGSKNSDVLLGWILDSLGLVKRKIESWGEEEEFGALHRIMSEALLLEPFPYDKLVYSLKNCYFVITDSGGLQEEAPALGKPVLVTRNTTEREEAIEEGSSELVGTNSENIYSAAKSLLSDQSKYLLMSKSIKTFGDGTASKKIIELISKRLDQNKKA